MTLMQRMRQELVRRNYAATTIHSYLKAVEHFKEYVKSSLEQLGPDDLRNYHAYREFPVSVHDIARSTLLR